MGRTLRPYQREAVDAVYADWAAEPIPTAVVLPTGCGKTDIIAQHCVDEAHRGGRTLVLAGATELVGQIIERVRMHDPAVTTGVAQGDGTGRVARRKVVVGMVQTLQHERRRGQLLEPTKVIVDECDLAVAPMYQKVLDWAGCGEGTPTFGVTATLARSARPKRGEKGLGDVWPRVAYQRDIHWAVESGYLVKPRGKVVVLDHLDLGRAKVRGGDYADDEVAEMVVQDMGQIVASWLEHGEGRLTAAIWPTIDTARAACEAFDSAGVKSEMITGKSSAAERGSVSERTGIYGRFALGVTRMLHLVGVGIRGWDCPPIGCILWGRPTRSAPFYIQGVGRGLRPLDPAEWPMHPPKDDLLVLDAVGASRVNGLVALPQLYRGAEVQDDRPAPVPPPEPVERAPARERPKLEGPATYVEHDLFQGSGSGCHWQTTRRKGRIFLAVGVGSTARLAVLWPEPDGSWTAAHCAATSTSRDTRNPFDIHDLRVGVSMAEAKLVAEAWARSYGGADLARRAAERARYRKAAPYLLARAARVKVANADQMSAARVEEECDRAVASSRLDLL